MNLRFLSLFFFLSSSQVNAFSSTPAGAVRQSLLTSPSTSKHNANAYKTKTQLHIWGAPNNKPNGDQEDPAPSFENDKNSLNINSSSDRFDSIADMTSQIKDNVVSGELGSRGESYFVAQATLVLCIIYGDIPVLGDFISFILGPLLFFLGIVVGALGVKDLGSNNLSPWPSTMENSKLVTEGIYNEIRHPIYAGLLYFCLGLSMWTGSAMRVLLSLGLYILLEKKTMFEEEQLVDKFETEYLDYTIDVGGKFIPEKVVDAMPWTEDK